MKILDDLDEKYILNFIRKEKNSHSIELLSYKHLNKNYFYLHYYHIYDMNKHSVAGAFEYSRLQSYLRKDKIKKIIKKIHENCPSN